MIRPFVSPFCDFKWNDTTFTKSQSALNLKEKTTADRFFSFSGMVNTTAITCSPSGANVNEEGVTESILESF